MDRIAFQVGSFPITWYGILMATAFLVGLWTASRRGIRDGLHPEKTLDVLPWAIIGTVLGARIVYVITYWKDSFAGGPLIDVIKIWEGGMVYYGGFLGASAGVVLYSVFKKVPLWKLADALAPSIALGYVFGRIGCLLNGCCFGKPCDLPWAIEFSRDSYAHHQQIRSGLIAPGDATLPVHPTQVYEAALSLALYFGLACLYRRKKFDGQVFATYMICYACFRSLVEVFRGDYTPDHLHNGLTPAHLISILILLAGFALWVLLSKSRPKPS